MQNQRSIFKRKAVQLLSIVCAICIHSLPATANAQDNKNVAIGNIAFHYGDLPPVVELQAFDQVVVDPGSNIMPAKLSKKTEWLAYVSVGELDSHASYAKTFPREWLIGENKVWESKVIDQAAAGWPEYFASKVIGPLWERGFRGFFLDTLDTYQLVAKTPDELARQEAGLIATIREIKKRYPDAKLIFNRGFEILPQVSDLASAVAMESLFKGWDQASKRYVTVKQADRDWLLGQIKTIRETYKLPVISIDYCAPADKACAADTVSKISELGITPYVSDGGLSSVGRGKISVVPRRILIVQNREADINIDNSEGVRFLATPLNYLGYKVEFADIKEGLPAAVSSDIYAGIVVWANGPMGGNSQAFIKWLGERVNAGVRVAFMNQFGVPVDGALGKMLGLRSVPGRPQGAVKVSKRDPMIGFELMPAVDARNTVNVKAGEGSTPLLSLSAGNYVIDAAAITPWGGYVMAPYAVVSMDELQQARWAIQPLQFFQRALRLDLLPAPDTTTENGTRLLMAHVDGDGFASKNEFFPGGYPGDTLYKEVWERYKIPTTLSVIEGEVGEKGLYPKLSPQLEAMAKRMFALPYVEVASHTFSHPFEWDDTVKHTRIKEGKLPGPLTEDFHLPIKGYVYDLDREIAGTINYINSRLTTKQKPVEVLLWPGSCDPPEIAVRKAYEQGVLNMNGGDTLITKSNPSWTAIAPLGINKGEGAFQVFAPNQNEDLYTNEWTGPYYGFERVIETFEMTDLPYRFKPVDIYYHMYSGTKLSSLKALIKVYDYALAQPNFPIHVTDYARKVLDFENMAVAKEGDEWIVRGAGDLRTVRVPVGAVPNLEKSSGVLGYVAGPAGTYLHLAGDTARFSIGTESGKSAYVANANGRISDMQRVDGKLQFNLRSYVKPQLRLASAAQCKATVDGKSAQLVKKGEFSQLEFSRNVANGSTQRIEVNCGN
ncbi:hypothetical protein D3C72_199600 [compost metagenome]